MGAVLNRKILREEEEDMVRERMMAVMTGETVHMQSMQSMCECVNEYVHV